MRWARRTGDVDEAFHRADHVVTGRYALPRLAAVPMETRGCVAEYDQARDELTVWASVQDTHRPRAQLAHILGRPEARIRIIAPDVGGAFGSKGVIAPEVAAVAAAAIALGIPVKWTEDRFENLLACYQGRGIEGDLELALDSDGRILGLRAALWADLGGYLLTTTPIPPHTAATLITGCYEIPTADVVMAGMRTHRPPTGPYRGAGRPDATYMIEALLDAGARALGLDRIELRRRNLVRSFPHLTATGLEYDSGDYDRCLDLALELAGPQARADLTSPPPTAARPSGTGVALYVERAGGGFESAAISLESDGSFTVATSANAHGQGHDDHVRPDRGRASAGGAGGDRHPFRRQRQRPARSRHVRLSQRGHGGLGDRRRRRDPHRARTGGGESDPGRSEPSWPRACSPAAGQTLTWSQLAEISCGQAPAPDGTEVGPLHAEATFRSPNVFSSGAYVATVAIDHDTGALNVTGLVAVDDSGTVINPLLTHGQVVGRRRPGPRRVPDRGSAV